MDQPLEEQQPQETIAPENCNCNDEFITEPCPVHSVSNTVETPYDTNAMVITDADISDAVFGAYEGFKFNCPDCKVPSIMVNEYMGKFCTNCGKPVIVRSKLVTDYLRKLQNGGQHGRI